MKKSEPLSEKILKRGKKNIIKETKNISLNRFLYLLENCGGHKNDNNSSEQKSKIS